MFTLMKAPVNCGAPLSRVKWTVILKPSLLNGRNAGCVNLSLSKEAWMPYGAIIKLHRVRISSAEALQTMLIKAIKKRACADNATFSVTKFRSVRSQKAQPYTGLTAVG